MITPQQARAAELIAKSDDIGWDIRQTDIVAWAFEVRQLLAELVSPEGAKGSAATSQAVRAETPTREQVEALRLDHAPSTYQEMGWDSAIDCVLALYDTKGPTP